VVLAIRKGVVRSTELADAFTPDPVKVGSPLLNATAEHDRRAKDDDLSGGLRGSHGS
jgi:hypothetical protein